MKKQIWPTVWLALTVIYVMTVFINPNPYISLLKPDTERNIMLFDLRYSTVSVPQLILSYLNNIFSTPSKTVFNPRTVTEENDGHSIVTEEERQIVNSGNINYKNISIMNSTDKKLDINELMGGYVPISDRKKFKILIIHTHGTEAYEDQVTARTKDTNKNIVKVGSELAEDLKKKGFNVLHDVKMHDADNYNKSYANSLLTTQWYLQHYNDIGVIIDMHRDAIENDKGERVKVTYDNDGEKTAQLMVVAGSNGGGLTHDNWQNNLRFAVGIQETGQTLYEGLMRPLNFRNERFNQHLHNNYIILEVGTHGNSLKEALKSTALFADILDKYIK